MVETIAELAVKPFGDRIQLLAQIIHFSCRGRGGDQKTARNGRHRQCLTYSSHTDHKNDLPWDRFFQSGMLPCLRGGLASRLFSNSFNARISFWRVNLGSITSSMKPRSAAT